MAVRARASLLEVQHTETLGGRGARVACDGGCSAPLPDRAAHSGAGDLCLFLPPSLPPQTRERWHHTRFRWLVAQAQPEEAAAGGWWREWWCVHFSRERGRGLYEQEHLDP